MQTSSLLKALTALICVLLSDTGLADNSKTPVSTEPNKPSGSVIEYNIVTNSQPEIREQFKEAGFENVFISETKAVKPSDNNIPFTHHFFTTNIIFRNSGWTKNDVSRNMEKSANIFSQCGVLLSGYSIIISDPVNSDTSYSITRKDDDGFTQDENILRKLPGKLQKPLIVYVTENTEGFAAYSWNAKNAKGKSLTNTIWINKQVLDHHKMQEIDGKDHNLIAHELAHILLNEEDQNFPNLLSGKYLFSNNELTEVQCKKLKNSPLVSEIAH